MAKKVCIRRKINAAFVCLSVCLSVCHVFLVSCPSVSLPPKLTPPKNKKKHDTRQADPRPKRTVVQYVCKAAMPAEKKEKEGEDEEARLAEDMYRAFVQTVARWVFSSEDVCGWVWVGVCVCVVKKKMKKNNTHTNPPTHLNTPIHPAPPPRRRRTATAWCRTSSGPPLDCTRPGWRRSSSTSMPRRCASWCGRAWR